MSRKARKRAAAASAVALAIGLAFATGAIHGAWANFQAETQNTNAQFGGGWINAPTSLSASPSGYGGSFTWVHGNTGVSPFGALTSQQLYVADQGTTNNCTSVTYSTVGSALSGTANSTSDAESSAVNGHYLCYMLRSFMNTWSVDTNFVPSPVQVGLAPGSPSVSYSTSGQITNGTTITIEFNQNISFSSANTRVCTFTSGVILLGDSTAACSSSGDTPVAGKLTGGTISRSIACTASSMNASGSTLTVTVGGCPTTGPPSGRAPAVVSGTATWSAPASGITSSTGGAPPCSISSCVWQLSY